MSLDKIKQEYVLCSSGVERNALARKAAVSLSRSDAFEFENFTFSAGLIDDLKSAVSGVRSMSDKALVGKYTELLDKFYPKGVSVGKRPGDAIDRSDSNPLWDKFDAEIVRREKAAVEAIKSETFDSEQAVRSSQYWKTLSLFSRTGSLPGGRKYEVRKKGDNYVVGVR